MTQSNSQKAAEQFVEKWAKVELSERAASHEHFIDLCRLIDEPTPASADATGEEYTFEKPAKVNGKARVAISRKSALARTAAELFKHGQKLRDTVIYDHLVQWLFQALLDAHRHSLISFAKRGKSDRLAALGSAISHAAKGGPSAQKGIMTIYADQPLQSPGLQVADYYLWVVQRLFERREDRFFNLLADDFQLIMDMDDRRNHQTGEWYTQENRIDPQKIMPETG